MIEAIEVWKGVKEKGAKRWILSDASVVIPAHRRVALLGASPEDRAVVLRVLAGIASLEGGGVRRSGLICPPLGGAGLVDPSATFRGNITLLSRIYDLEPSDIAKFVVSLSGVRVHRGRPIKLYDRGVRNQLMLAFALAIPFDWYFVNEALPPLSGEVVATYDRVLAERIERGGVVWATTQPELLRGYCNAGVVLDRGLLTFYDDFEAAEEAFVASRNRRGKQKA